MSIQNSHQISDVKILLKQGATGASIVSITKTGTSGLVDTYTVATSDGGRYTFEVTNGSDIQSIEKTSSHGMVDTYTVTLTNGNTTTFEVTNGDNWIDNSEKTATDAFQTITGGLLKECKVALSPVQSGSGDPSPTNVRPITGHTEVKVERCGKNMLWLATGTTTSNGVTFTVNSDGTVKIVGTATGGDGVLILARQNLRRFLNKSLIITGAVSTGGTSSRIQWWNYDGNNNTKYDAGSGTGAFTPTSDAGNIAIVVTNGTTIDAVFKPMMRLADAGGDSFETYDGTTYTVEIPSETGTVYGGILDLVSGQLVIDTGILDENIFGSISAGVSAGGLYFTDVSVPQLLESGDGYCSMLVKKSGGWVSETPCYVFSDQGGSPFIRIYCTEADIATFKANYADLQIVYPLATPTVIQLTPTQVETLIGDNNLLCPLAGQAMVEDGVKYFYIYTYHDLMEGLQNIADALEDDVTEITNNAVEEVSEMAGVWTASASASEADTSITITNENITTSSIIEVYCQNASGNPVSITNMAVTTGQAVLSFYALAEATSFRLHVLN